MTSRAELIRALRYVSDNLDRPLTVADIARAAGLSEFHLHRVFHAELGESIGRFITRRRLESAALRLAYEPSVAITSVALDSGYSSSSNFSKAFSAYFGCSPSQVRNPNKGSVAIGKLTSQYGRSFHPRDLYAVPPERDPGEIAREAARWDHVVRFENIEDRYLACLSSPRGYEFDAVSETWRELIARTAQLGLWDSDVDAWGMAHDSPILTAPERCRYTAGVPCEPGVELPMPLFLGSMPAGRYAVFLYHGPVSGVGEAYRSIYSCWFRDRRFDPADLEPFDHYVGNEPRNGIVEAEFWVRVQPRA